MPNDVLDFLLEHVRPLSRDDGEADGKKLTRREVAEDVAARWGTSPFGWFQEPFAKLRWAEPLKGPVALCVRCHGAAQQP